VSAALAPICAYEVSRRSDSELWSGHYRKMKKVSRRLMSFVWYIKRRRLFYWADICSER